MGDHLQGDHGAAGERLAECRKLAEQVAGVQLGVVEVVDRETATPHTVHNSVFTQVGGIAAGLVERNSDCLSTVTDGDGRILSDWATGRTARKRPSATWPVLRLAGAGNRTNGMGAALNQARPVAVRGPAHWCEALHDRYCLGVAIHDTVTRDPIAVLNVSSWEHDVLVEPRVLAERTESVRRPAACSSATRAGGQPSRDRVPDLRD